MELPENEFITLDQASEILGVHKTTLQSWILKDKLYKQNPAIAPKDFKCPPYGRIGYRYRFRKEEIERFIKESMGE